MSSETSSLLEVRQITKGKKPNFIRQDNNRRIRIGNQNRWRKPKGIHSKIRHHFKGRRKMPSPGYKSPIQVKGLHSTGLKMVNVYSVDDVQKIKKDEGIIIARSVGHKKRIEMLKKAKELNLNVLNFNIDAKIKEIESMISSKSKKETKENKKEIKHKESKQKEEQSLSDKEKKDFEKKEKDKLLTKKV